MRGGNDITAQSGETPPTVGQTAVSPSGPAGQPVPGLCGAVAWTRHHTEAGIERGGLGGRRAVLTSQSWPTTNGQLVVVKSLSELVALLQQQTTAGQRRRVKFRVGTREEEGWKVTDYTLIQDLKYSVLKLFMSFSFHTFEI